MRRFRIFHMVAKLMFICYDFNILHLQRNKIMANLNIAPLVDTHNSFDYDVIPSLDSSANLIYENDQVAALALLENALKNNEMIAIASSRINRRKDWFSHRAVGTAAEGSYQSSNDDVIVQVSIRVAASHAEELINVAQASSQAASDAAKAARIAEIERQQAALSAELEELA